MKKAFFYSSYLFFLLMHLSCVAQKTTLEKRVNSFLSDPQMQYAQFGFGAINLETGKKVLDTNTKSILTPASTLKIFTSISAYEILGKDFRFQTKIYQCKDQRHSDAIHLQIEPSGDPTFGSSNFETTKAEYILAKLDTIVKAFPQKNITISFASNSYSSQVIPNGWAFNDIGNYYGTGSFAFNWRENFYPIRLKSGKAIGDAVEVLESFYPFINELVSEKLSSGDNCYIYPSLQEKKIYLRGSIPINESNFVVKAASFDPNEFFVDELKKRLLTKNIQANPSQTNCKNESRKLLFTFFSPSLEEIVTQFHTKSINLYGEALIKRIALEKTGLGDTNKGIDYLKSYFEKKGFDAKAMKVVDGSGLSAGNGINTNTQLQLLKYAYQQNWGKSFLNSLPLKNGLRIKSGTISGVKGYSGYAYNKKGELLAFSILANNFSGSSSEMAKKLFFLLESLKEIE